MTEGESKQLSKKELKRLAKKAEREAKKDKGGGGGGDNDDGKKNATPPVKAPVEEQPSTTTLPSKAMYYLANVSSEDCASGLKASIAAAAFGISLCRSSAATHPLPALFNGPAMFENTNTSNVAFGGNGITKALSLITGKGNATNPLVDEWLEVERTSLRDSASAKEKTNAMTKIESALSESSGYFLVGNELSAADIAIVVTLSKQPGEKSSVVQTYINTHLQSDAFVNGKAALTKLIPPPSFDVKNHPSMMRAVNSVFFDAIANLLPHIAHTLGDEDGFVIEKSKQLKFGDYQCKEAMPLFSKLKSSSSLPAGVNSPQQLAQAIVDKIPTENLVCDSININGPGFILCKVKASYLEHHVNTLINSSVDGSDPKMPLPLNVKEKGQAVVVDFSSPNIAKEMHVGHLRSTIIGESVCRILELVGADVKRVNHVGDWGTQFGMLITYLKEANPEFATGGNEDVAISDLTAIYKQAKVSLSQILYMLVPKCIDYRSLIETDFCP